MLSQTTEIERLIGQDSNQTVKREGVIKTTVKLLDSPDSMKKKVNFLPKLVFTLKANC